MKLAISIVLTVLSLFLTILMIGKQIVTKYKYEKEYFSYWQLADKSSTIEEKSIYIDRFVIALREAKMEGKNNALILTTPDNSFDYNFKALLSLQIRLKEIKQMDVKSFEYQTAIQQITAQEQGEAENMLNVFSGIYWQTYNFMCWEWVGIVWGIFITILWICCFILWFSFLLEY